MFKNEINFIYDFNLTQLQLLGDRVTIKDIKSSKIHPALVHFIDAAIDSEIFYDRKKIETDSIFNYTSDRINNYFTLISEEIKRIQIFKTGDIKDILQKGIIFNVNYLTQPNKTLTKFIFDNSEVKSVEEIIIAVSHAYYYRYLKKILLTYLEKKKILLMRRDEFYSLLLRIDEISKETHIEDTLSTAVNSMVNFFDPHSKASEKLPLGAVVRYLEEKRLTEYKAKLEQTFGIENILFSANEILSELKSVTPETEMEIDVQKQQEELIADKSGDDENDNESYQVESLNVEDLSETEIEPKNDEILEVEDAEVEIPNSQLLSEDDFTNDKVDPEINESKEDHPEEDSSSEKTEKRNEPENDNKSDNQSLKKKPDSTFLINKLIDVRSIYESMLPEVKPFKEFIENHVSNIKNDEIFQQINFLHDQSTLVEELSQDLPIEDKPRVDIKNDDLKDKATEENISNQDNEIITAEEKVEMESDNLSLTIDEVVSDEKLEEEFLAENNSLEVVDQDIVQSVDEIELIPDEDIDSLEEEEELTEVFKDLAFLEKSENSSDIDRSNEIEDISESHEGSEEKSKESSDSKTYEDYRKFTDLLSQNDMTKIIEHIFDYDMEDYHYIIDRISNSSNEDEALSFTLDYCRDNHIDISSPEVDHFKSLISEYFSQAYS